MGEAVQLQLAVEVATGAESRTGLLLGKRFSVVLVDPDPATCARVSARYATEIADGRLRVMERTPAGVSALAGPEGGLATGLTPGGIDWPDLQLLVGSPYYLRIGSAEPPIPFLASMSCARGLPAMISVACPDAAPLELLSAFGFHEFAIATTALAPEFTGLGPRAHRWMTIAEAREYRDFAAASGAAAGLVCHARR